MAHPRQPGGVVRPCAARRGWRLGRLGASYGASKPALTRPQHVGAMLLSTRWPSQHGHFPGTSQSNTGTSQSNRRRFPPNQTRALSTRLALMDELGGGSSAGLPGATLGVLQAINKVVSPLRVSPLHTRHAHPDHTQQCACCLREPRPARNGYLRAPDFSSMLPSLGKHRIPTQCCAESAGGAGGGASLTPLTNTTPAPQSMPPPPAPT